MRRLIWTLLIGGALCACALAQTSAQGEGKRVVRVEYVPPDQPLDAKDLALAQPLKAGQVLGKDDISNAIDKLFATGEYDDIQVDVQPSGTGVVVRFITKPKYFVGHVGAQGKIKSPPTEAQIVNAAQLNLGQPFDPKEANTAQANIRNLFERNGLYESSVQFRLEPSPTAQQMSIIFDVRSNRRAKYDTPIITGDPKLPQKDIIKATHWRRFLIGGWKQVTEARSRDGVNGIHRKYQSKDRLMAKVNLTSMKYNPDKHTATPTLDITGGPKVKVRTVEAKVSKRKLKRYIPVYQEGTVDRDLLVEGARNLRDYFQAQGYYEAQIDFRQKPIPDKDETDIEYVISKGKRHKLVRLDITGNKYFKKDEIQERLILRPASFQFRHGRYSEAFRNRDVQTIENLYKSNGFRDVRVNASVTDDYKGKSGDIAVTYNIEEGAQWFVSKLDVTGMTTPDRSRVLAQLSSLQGQPFSDLNVAADRKTILDYYFSNGYPDARFEWNFTPTGQPDHVDLKYTVVEGKPQFVRDVLFTGLQTTKMRVINNNVHIQKGDPLAPIAMNNAQKKLYDLGIFAKVDTAIQNPEGATEDKYVLYDIQEASRYTLNFGVGAEVARFGPTTNSLSAPAGSTGFSPRFLMDLSRINFLGIGHTVSLQGRLSNLEQRALLNYYAPRFRNHEGRNITYTMLYDKNFDVRTFASKREEASIQVSQEFSKALTGLLRFSYRRVTTSDVVIPTLLVPQLLQPVRLGMLSANLVEDRRDNPLDAHRGIYNSFDTGLASNIFGSQRSFVRAIGRNATYTLIRGKNWVLARQITFGTVLPFRVPPEFQGASDYIPLPERFFGGGADTNRGFPYNQAGPRDIGTPAGPGGKPSPPTGFPLGGNAVFFHNTELRFPLMGDNISGVIFHDMGNVYRSFSDISFRVSQRNLQDFNYMVHAAGFGIRYRTPVGPIRVDLAYSINPPSFLGFKGTIQDLLSCNPNSAAPASPACTPVKQSISHFQFFFSIGQAF